MNKTQFSIVLANRSGELASVAEVLAEAQVNVEALSISDGVHIGVLKIVVSDPAAARAAFRQANIGFHEQDVLAVPVPNRPGAIAQLCAKLAAAGHSIDYVYGSACDCTGEKTASCQPVLILAVSDRTAVDALKLAALWPGP